MVATYLITHRRMDNTLHGGKHIGKVQLSDGTTLTRQEVLNHMRQGVVFYTYAPNTGREAKVIPYHCPHCGVTYITTEADAWKDDNLDHLPYF